MHRPYELIISEPFLCVAATLEMVLRSEGIYQLGQRDIAEYFGVNFPSGQAVELSNAHVTEEPGRWGIVIPKEGLGPFFSHFKIDLSEHFSPIAQLQDWEFTEIIEKQLSQGCHVICGFSYEALHGRAKPDEGHVALVLSVDRERMLLLDPGPRGAGKCEVDISALYRAIHVKRDGLWVITHK